MKIAISATGPTLDDAIDPRFGRCAYFLVVQSDDLSFAAIENTSAALSGGAGIQAAQVLAREGVQTILTGNCGPNAHQALAAAGIGFVTGCSGVIREVLEQHRSGKLSPAKGPDVVGHTGTGGDPAVGGRGVCRGRGMGGGGGRGMGLGGGRGGGRSSGRHADAPAAPFSGSEAMPGGDLKTLRQQADDLERRLERVRRRIQDLERPQ